MKLNYKKVFLLGFGFFSVSIVWSAYNAFMPKILSNFTTNAALIGFIMTIDNYLALFMQPAIGAYSDKHDTKFGRRMPFLMIGMPLAALFLFILPHYWSFKTLIIFLVLLNLSMSIFRAPVIALMPDITPVPLRSKANSIINLMGGIGSVIAYFIGSILWEKSEAYPFYLGGILVVISFVILFSNVNEHRDSIEFSIKKEIKETCTKEAHKETPEEKKIRNKNIIFLLIAICCYFIAYQGTEAFFTLYGEKYLGISVKAAASSFTFISLSFLLFAYPAGIIGTKFGKRKTMIAGIIGFLVSFLLITTTKNLTAIRIIFVFAGICWSLININSYPFVVEMASKSNTGVFTGYYYTASSIAAITSPVFLGFLINKLSYGVTFFYGAIFLSVSLVFMLLIKPLDSQKI